MQRSHPNVVNPSDIAGERKKKKKKWKSMSYHIHSHAAHKRNKSSLLLSQCLNFIDRDGGEGGEGENDRHIHIPKEKLKGKDFPNLQELKKTSK